MPIATQMIADEVCAANQDYQALLAEFDRLESIKTTFEDTIKDQLYEWGNPHISDWEYDDDDPEPGDFKTHVERANNWSSPWRPFSQTARTDSLVEWLRDGKDAELYVMECQEINWHEKDGD